MKIHLAEMTWPEIQDLLKRPNAVLIPTGSTEQHGPHLPVNVDSACATYISERAAEMVNVENHVQAVVAPTLHYTEIDTFADFPGSIGISVDTEARVVADITRSFLRQGFKNLIFVNGHASNALPINMGLRQVTAEITDAGLFAVNWWALGFETIPKIRKSQVGLHADELETSLSLLIQEENVHMEKAVKEFPKYSLSEKWAKPDLSASSRVLFHSRKKYPKMGSGYGVMGDPTVASKETGEKIAEAVIRDLAELALEVIKSEKEG